jgi:hypothetical protein
MFLGLPDPDPLVGGMDPDPSHPLNFEATAFSARGVMSDLKTQLYAKFGDAINLEADD